VLLLDDMSSDLGDKTIHSVAHGVLRLEELAPSYGAERRRARVVKYRGVKFRGGYHDVTITTGGLERVSAAGGVGASDELRQADAVERHRRTGPTAGSGVESGSSTLILGPAGPANLCSPSFSRRRDGAGREGGLLCFR
jgi:circadian clock protein KaiC